jgi:UDP-glucose:(heptosyl)LPS alpha-1,3-glucosyltransferase
VNGSNLVAFCLFKHFPHGGMQRNFLRTARAVVARGFRVRAYALSWVGDVPDGIDVVRVPVCGVANHRRYARFERRVHALLARDPPACVVGFNRMRGLDAYYAADPCYALKMERIGAWQRALPRHRYFLGAERAVFERGGNTKIMLIAVREQRAYEACYGTEPERFTVLPPGIARDRCATADAAGMRAELRRELALGEDELLMLMIGSGFATKGLDRALRSLSRLPADLRARTRLVAMGQDNARPFARLARRLGVAARVQILAGRDDVPRFLQGADVLVHPAYSETAGNVLLEALVAGLPSVVSAACGNAHYVEEARAGCVVPEPFAQAAFDATLADLLRDPRRRAELRENGIAFGRNADLYSLPERAAAIIAELAERKRSEATRHA